MWRQGPGVNQQQVPGRRRGWVGSSTMGDQAEGSNLDL